MPPLELAAAYATLARGGVFMPLRLLEQDPLLSRRVLSRDTCTAIEECLAGPPNEFSEAMPFIASKTGTSSGHRDAIAAGWNRAYAAVVWVGRFDGGSDPELLGAEAAMPILQELLHHPTLLTVRTPNKRNVWVVRRQVGRSTPRLPAILEPRDGDVLCAVLDEIHITPKLRTAGSGAVLFLNGAPVRDARLRLGLGKHELRLVEKGREPHAITVEVIDAVLAVKAPVMVLSTTALEHDSASITELRLRNQVDQHRIEMAPLIPQAASSLVEELLPLDSKLEARLVRETAGNPGKIRNIMLHWVRTGALRESAHSGSGVRTWELADEASQFPLNATHFAELRLAHLGDDIPALEALHAITLSGSGSPLSVLERVVGEGLDRLRVEGLVEIRGQGVHLIPSE